MNQIALMQIATRLEPGQAIEISANDLREAAKGELSSLMFDQVRPGDVEIFAEKIAKNWGVQMRSNPMTGAYTMSKQTPLGKIVEPYFSWECLDEHSLPAGFLWGFGVISDDPAAPQGKRMDNIQARIERREDGKWNYIVFGPPVRDGLEPSKGEAMTACEFWMRRNR